MYYIFKTGMGICVEDCPTVAGDPTSTVQAGNYYCLNWLEEKVNGNAATFASYITNACMTSGTYDEDLYCSCNVIRPSSSVFNRCIYTDGGSSINAEDPTSEDYMKMWMSDVYTARNVIFGFGFCIALVFGFLYTYLMSISWVAYTLVWTCIILTLGLVVGMTATAQGTLDAWNAEDPAEHTDNQINALQGFVWTCLIVTIIWFFLMIFMCKAINVAIKCVIMGATALDEMPMLVLFPIVQITMFMIFMTPWTIYCMFIASQGEFDIIYQDTYDPTTGTDASIAVGRNWVVDSEANVSMKLWFMLFCLLWTMNFISNFGSLVISHAVATWYFTLPDERVEKISNRTIWESFKLCFRFHLGSVAFGSLLIALIQFARAVALYIQKSCSEEFKSKSWVKIVFCCINCCLWCLECCMKFIAKHAYIQVAIHGTPFCPSARNMFSLIARNILRIGALVFTAELCLFIGKLFVTVLATATSYYFLSAAYADKLYDLVAPTMFVAIMAWMTATMFMDVLHMGVDTILHCFISDEEHNNGVAVFATDNMKDMVDTHGKMEIPEGKEGESDGVEVPNKN
jgi:choline transporter-like protein 2/4/5